MRSKILKSRLLLLCTRHGLGSREQALARIDDDSVFQCRGPLQLGCEADATFLIFRSKLHRAHKVAPLGTEALDWELPFRLLGLYFQIRDDYANLRLPSYAVNKSFAEDLTEGQPQSCSLKAISLKLYEKTENVIFAGKFSFPILHCIQSSGKSDDRVWTFFPQRIVSI